MTQLDQIQNELNEIKLDMGEIKQLLNLIIPKARLPRRISADSRLDNVQGIERDRAVALLSLFEKTCKLTLGQKIAQKFPNATYQEKGMEIVPRSLLINRAAMRAIFKADFRRSPDTTNDIVVKTIETLKNSKLLIEMPLNETKLETPSMVVCLFSPRWADRAMGITAEEVQPKKHSGLHWTPPVKEAKSKLPEKETEKHHSGLYWSPVSDADLSNPGEEDEPFEGFGPKKIIEL